MSGTSRLQMVSSHLRWSVPKSGKSRCVLFSNVLQPGITGLARKSWKFQLERSLFEDGKFLEGTCSSITVCCYCFPSSESSFRLCFTLSLCANALLDEGFPFFYTWFFYFPSLLFVPISSRCPDKTTACFSAFSENLCGSRFDHFSTDCYYLSFLLPCRPALVNILVWWEHRDKTWIRTVDVCDLF